MSSPATSTPPADYRSRATTTAPNLAGVNVTGGRYERSLDYAGRQLAIAREIGTGVGYATPSW
jgi:hypothetical protein